MAESYRGLTISIGGDTTKLNKALQTSRQAINSTQSDMKKLSDALRLDPTSLKAAQMQVGIFAEQASNAATRLVTLNEAMRQVGDKAKVFQGSAGSVREMADNINDLSMKVSQARDYYARLTDSVAESYTNLTALHKEASKTAGKNLAEKLSESFENMDFDKVIDGVSKINSSFGNEEKNLDGLLKKLGSMKETYTELTEKAQGYQDTITKFQNEGQEVFLFHGEADNKDYALARMNQELADAAAEATQELPKVAEQLKDVRKEFRDTVSEISKFKGIGEKFSFDEKNVDLPSLAKALKAVADAGVITTQRADEMYDAFEKMKGMWQEAFNDVKTGNVLEGFRDLKAEAAQTEAKIAALVEQLIRMTEVEAVQGIATLEQRLHAVATAGGEASSRLKESLDVIQSSIKNNKGAVAESQMADAMRAYADAVDAAEAKVKILEKEIEELNKSGIATLVGESKQGLASMAQESEQHYREMATAVELYESALNDVNKEMLKIKGDDPKNYEESDRYKELAQQAKAYNEVLRITRNEARSAKEEFSDMTKALTLRDKQHELEVTKNTLTELNNINIKPEVDVSAIDGLKKSLEAISNGIFDSKGSNKFGDVWDFSKTAENINIASAALDNARNKYKALAEAAKNDPTNSATIQAGMQAAEQYAKKLEAAIAAYREQIDSIPTSKIDQAALATGTVAEAFAKAKIKVDDANKALVATETQIKALTKERDGIKIVDSKSALQFLEINRRIDALKASLVQLQQEADVALDNFATADNTRRIDEAQTKVRALRGEYSKLKDELGHFGKESPTPQIDEAAFMQVVESIANAARQMGQEIVQASNDIDSAYRNMRKTVNGTEAEFENLRQTAVEFSQTHITSADTMLEMQALGGQLGILVEDLETFGKIGSNLDIATDMDAEDIALKLGQISNVLNLDIDGTQGFADALVRLGNNMPATESSIMAVAQRFGAVAATANFSGDEILAWAASIASTGQRSEAAATAIGNTVSGIEQAIANGGATLKQFAAIAGMSADEFAQSWKSSPTEALKAFIEGLQTLSDSDESAVAALENMGITGVRQQQTLLGLSQTIGNLDDALAMSANAWNQVSDQWGQAGDAANEAEKKSQGFSGALAIMQNNAQNLAASLGDGLIPLINAASKAMEIITDILSEMPGWLKAAIVDVGALGLAFSTITPMLNVFGKGMGSVIAAFSSTANLADFIAKLTGLEGVLMGAAEGGVNLVTAFSGPVALGIAAAVAAIGLAINAIQDYSHEQEVLETATRGLTSATQSSADSYNDYVTNAQAAKMSTTELKDSIEECIEAQANLAEKMSEEWGNIGTSEATVDTLVKKITELGEKSSLTAGEQNELLTMVKQFNTLTGNNIQVIDAQNGELDTNVKKLQELSEAWKESRESAQHMEDYSKQLSQLADLEKQLEEVNKRLGDTSNEQNQWFVDMRDSANGVAGEYTTLVKEQERLESAIASCKQAIQTSVDGMGDLHKQAAAVEAAFQEAGDSLSNYGDFTDSQLMEIVAAFYDTSDASVDALTRVRNAIDRLMSGAGDASGIVGQIEEASKEARTKLYNDTKERYADEYDLQKTELSRAYDAQKTYYDSVYNAQKHAYDAEYNSLKESLDKQYNERKRAYDHEYDALKKKFDKEYNEAKRNYDHQEDALKDSLDDQYDDMKDALDKQYNERKRAYDRGEEALKTKLDNELNAQKVENDAALSEFKRARDLEVTTYKNDTDLYLEELKKRYEASVRNEEHITDAKVKEIDKRIAALKGETTKEQNAVKELKEDNKIAELQKAVNQAKSRRKRQEAEKKLNDYLVEVQADRNERERKLQIEQLEDEKKNLKDDLDSRKENMKIAYEDERDAYQNMRDIKIQDMKLANEIEYEEYKRTLDEEERVQKESNDRQINAMKESHSIKLEDLKAENSERLEELKKQNEAELEALKESDALKLENMKLSQQEQLDSLKESQSIALEEMKNSQQAQLESMKNGQQLQLEAMKASHAAQLQQQKYDNEDYLKNLKERQEASLKAIKEGGEEETKALEAEQEKQIELGKAKREYQTKNNAASLEEQSRYLTEMDKQYGSYSAAEKQKQAEFGVTKLDLEYKNNRASLEEQSRHLTEMDNRYGSYSESVKRTVSSTGEELVKSTDNSNKDMSEHSERDLSELSRLYGLYGLSSVQALGRGLGDDDGTIDRNVQELAEKMKTPFVSLSTDSGTWGSHFIANFYKGIVDTWNDSIHDGIVDIAEFIQRVLGHSVPKEGPLRHDDEWGSDFVQNLIDGIKQREGALVRQVEHLSAAMEEAYDPTLTVDAAYEAIEKINKGQYSAGAIQTYGAASNDQVFNVNVNLSNVSIRSDADIEALATEISKRMAAQASRQKAGRL